MPQNSPAITGPGESKAHLKAIELLAAGNLTQEEIANQAGVDRKTLYHWRQDPDFAAKVEARVEEIGAEVRRIGIANQTKRIAALNDRWNRMRRVIEARADDPDYRAAPGGSTGLLVRQTKKVGHGKDAEVVHEFSVDTGLLAEMRATEKQAAQELGQWSEKHDLSGTVPPLAVQIVNVIDRIYKDSGE